MKKILAIGSHYDDIEIGCSGTLLKHIQNKDKVYFAITHTDEYRTGKPDDRMDEQVKSTRKMGLDKPQLFLFSETQSDSEIISMLDQLDADIIFAPFENDTHQHHRRTSIIAQSIGRKRHMTTLFYDSGSTYDFYPNIFSTIDFEKKLRILNCFKSQIIHGSINLDIVKKKNAYWSSLVTEICDSYAEGFIIKKMRWII